MNNVNKMDQAKTNEIVKTLMEKTGLDYNFIQQKIDLSEPNLRFLGALFELDKLPNCYAMYKGNNRMQSIPFEKIMYTRMKPDSVGIYEKIPYQGSVINKPRAYDLC